MHVPLEATRKEKGHTSGSDLENGTGAWPRSRSNRVADSDTRPDQCQVLLRGPGTCPLLWCRGRRRHDIRCKSRNTLN
jgi:hypothetical protein